MFAGTEGQSLACSLLCDDWIRAFVRRCMHVRERPRKRDAGLRREVERMSMISTPEVAIWNDASPELCAADLE